MTALLEAIREVERHVHRDGWENVPRLYALVETDELLEREPQMAADLGLTGSPDSAGGLSAIEQEELPEYASLEELLAGIAWPPEVKGTALVVERIVLPGEAESALPADQAEALRVVGGHPDRQEMRLAVGVLRDGARACVVRLRDHPQEDDVLVGPDIAPGLAEALAATLQD